MIDKLKELRELSEKLDIVAQHMDELLDERKVLRDVALAALRVCSFGFALGIAPLKKDIDALRKAVDIYARFMLKESAPAVATGNAAVTGSRESN